MGWGFTISCKKSVQEKGGKMATQSRYISRKTEKKNALKQLNEWLSDRNASNDVPRMVDVWDHVVRDTDWPLTLKDVKRAFRLHHNYMMNVTQQRPKGKSKLYRPIVMTNLGHWHADVGFFSINSKYPTPITYRAGFLVAKDVVSRYIYATPLLKNRKADAMIKAFNELFKQHNNHLPKIVIKSISFDRETSVMSNKVQSYLSEKGIDFHAFKFSSSKAKAAENAIKQIRTIMARLMRQNRIKDRWWNLLEPVRQILNNQEIVIDGKRIGFSPADINQDNINQFLEKLYQAVPAYLWAQIDVDPEFVDFKYDIGTNIRIKLIETSSAVLGVKRSEQNVTKDLFVIEKLIPFITRKMTIGKAYLCRNVSTGDTEVLEEDIIVEAIEDDDLSYPYWDQDPFNMTLDEN